MALIDELASLLSAGERALGAASVAAYVGADRLCLFVIDPELGKFLPGPGFPQTMPNGTEWRRFLRSVAERRAASGEAHLQSPYSGLREQVRGFRLDENAIVVLFGSGTRPDAEATLSPALRVVTALLQQEVRVTLAEAKAALSNARALESQQLAKALSEAHEKLAEVLGAREALLQEIRTKDERLQLATQISGVGAWELDPATGTISLAPETATIYGFSGKRYRTGLEDVLSRIHETDKEQVRNAIRAALQGEGNYHLHFRIVWPNRIVRAVEDRGVVVRDADGKITTMIGLIIDITQRVKSEEALVRSEKLAAAGRLAASIAHEINNPLEGLVNLVFLARQESNPDRVREFLLQADHELARVSGVARQALSFYRESTTPVRFDVCAVIRQVVAFYSKQFSESGVIVEPDLPDGGAEVEGWPGEIKQALSNLLINAIHASSRSGSVRIRVKRLDSTIQVTVADGGHGIGSQYLSHIFEPFFSTKKDSGTGLGLWVTKQIVERHGGSVRVRSRTGSVRHGTVFLLRLPVAGAVKQFKQWERNLGYHWLEMGAPESAETFPH